MATYPIVTSARQDEALAALLMERNAERAKKDLPLLPDVLTLIRLEFAERFQEADSRLRQIERPKIADAFDQADSTVRAQVRALLGVS